MTTMQLTSLSDERGTAAGLFGELVASKSSPRRSDISAPQAGRRCRRVSRRMRQD